MQGSFSSRDQRRAVVLVLAVSFGLRLLLLLLARPLPQVLLTPDSYDYLRLARGLLMSGQFGAAGEPEIFRVPGYPLFLAGLLKIADSARWVCLVQAGLDTVTCLLVWHLARRLAGQGAAIAALIFQALSVVSIVYCCRVLSETLFTLLLVVLLCLLAETGDWLRRRPSWTAVAIGLTMAAMAYIRTVTLPLMLLILLFLIYRRCWRQLTVSIAVIGFVLLPWVMRNQRLADYPGFSSVSAILLYRYNACLLLADQQGISFAEAQANIDSELAAAGAPAAAARLARNKAQKIIIAHPMRYAWLHVKTLPASLLPAAGELLQTCGVKIGGSGTLAVIHDRGLTAGVKHYFDGKWRWLIVALPMIATLSMVYLLATLGVFGMFRADPANRALWILFVVVMLYFLAVPGAAAHPRFRVPVMPILSIFAGIGWVRLQVLAKLVNWSGDGKLAGTG